jgi:hypothetical protein
MAVVSGPPASHGQFFAGCITIPPPERRFSLNPYSQCIISEESGSQGLGPSRNSADALDRFNVPKEDLCERR